MTKKIKWKIADDWYEDYHDFKVGDMVCTKNGNHDNLQHPTKIIDIQGKDYIVAENAPECVGVSYRVSEMYPMERR